MDRSQKIRAALSELSNNYYKSANRMAMGLLADDPDAVSFEILESSLLNEIANSHIVPLMMMSPVDRFVASHFLHIKRGHFEDTYVAWRMTRVRKLMEIYGIDFKDKRILELGAGIGDIGSVFAQLGADVVGLEGRAANCNFANLRFRDLKNYEIVQWDLENDFSKFGTFDIIINFGLVEVIANFEALLACCMSMSDTIFLETLVCDSTDPHRVVYVDMLPNIAYNDWPISGKSPWPSPYYIERLFSERDFKVNRYFHGDLNAYPHVYDWPHKNDNSTTGQPRRFWTFTKGVTHIGSRQVKKDPI